MSKKPTNNYNIEEIERVYNSTGNHSMSKTARILGFNRNTFIDYMNRNYRYEGKFIKK